VAELLFTRRFLRDLAQWEPDASPRDVALFDSTLAAIAADPELPGRIPSFYDPLRPSYLCRLGQLLIHYRLSDRGDLEFLNLFSRRP